MKTPNIGSLLEQENKLLQALALHQQQLRVVKPEELVPGLPLFYKLGEDYGCHIIRTVEQAAAQPYKDKAGLRAGVEAGTFLILSTNDEPNAGQV